MSDRDCPNCIHKKELGCEVWNCKFEPKISSLSRQDTISEIEEMKGAPWNDQRQEQALDEAIKALTQIDYIEQILNNSNSTPADIVYEVTYIIDGEVEK